MLEQKKIKGKVIKKNGSRVIVQPLKIDDNTQNLDAYNSVSAKVDDIVEVEYQQISERKDLMLLVFPPIFSTLAGALLGYRMQSRLPFPVEECILYGALVWLLFSMIYSFRYWKYSYGRGNQPVVIRKK